MKNDYKERVLKRIDDATEIEFSHSRGYCTDNGICVTPGSVRYLNVIVPLNGTHIGQILDDIEEKFHQLEEQRITNILSEL